METEIKPPLKPTYRALVEFRRYGQPELHQIEFSDSGSVSACELADAFVALHRDTAILDEEGKVIDLKRGDFDWHAQRMVWI